MPAHYRLAPSSSYRWLKCGGSARSDLPETTSEAAEEGTRAHTVACDTLLGEVDEPGKHPLCDDEDMAMHVQTYIDFVRDCHGSTAGARLIIEQQVPHPFIADFGGTLDVLLISDILLHVIDLKFGMRSVPTKGNTQLLSYLCLARAKHGKRKFYKISIVQPRVNETHPTEFVTDAELDEHELNVMYAAQDDKLVAGKHCDWCPLLGTCDVAYAALRQAAELDFVDISMEQLAKPDMMQRYLDVIDLSTVMDRLKAFAHDKLFEYAKSGRKVPGKKIVRSQGHRAWKDEDAVLRVLKRHNIRQEESHSPPKLKSPAQMEKILPKDELADLYTRPDLGLCLADESSNREEVKFDDEFGIIE